MTDYSQPDLESDFLPYKNVKLAATVAMNTSYHPYSDISPTHPPSPDNNNYPPLSAGGYHNGHIGVHTPQMTQMPDDVSPEYHHQNHHSNHHHPHHQLNNNNNSPIKHCAGCGEKISDRFLLHALDRYWHNSCLKCNCCGAMLADMGTSCYTRRGLILCKKDYSSMFGCSGTCSGCGQTIPPNELVAKAVSPLNQQTTNLDNQKSSQSNLLVFHLKCFLCTKCGAHLRPGDRYTMLAGSLVCEQDWHKIIKNNPGNGGAVGGGPGGASGSTTTTNGTTAAVRKGKVGRPRRTKE
ncbi:LIM/homeobox protein Lhx9 [Condylostylus longicornis]|uniref:LIM/homeobox protein Lhx9 n=1 Tax=Condylostylus longicornis TaxID=2530218 RepID=UPI00244E3715|nr:LIM/homeobox protein Lhx9 [Condylostylus longicornis]XP_055376437.1 LIM/homeobox protein Lhx9 [Condylostylus longicornis]